MKICVAGTGLTKFGELWDKSFYDLFSEAAEAAIKDAGISKDSLDAVFVGNMLFGKTDGQDHLGALGTTLLGMQAPAFRVEGACASGGLAVHLACQALIAGTYKKVLVVGVEKMTDEKSTKISSALMGAGSEEEREAGATFPALYALMAQAHMGKYGTTREQLASVAVKNHYHASLNEKAQYPMEISVEQVLASPPVSYPFNLLDSSPITDGAAAVVLTSETRKTGVFITASSVATDSVGLSGRASLTELSATRLAFQKAMREAAIKLSDVDVMEVHDCFTIAEIMAVEDLGFCKKGAGGAFIESGACRLGGEIPVNTSGGLKACGHPVGATGVKQIVELSDQIKGKVGKRQVRGAKVGLAQNVGGTGATVVVNVVQG